MIALGRTLFRRAPSREMISATLFVFEGLSFWRSVQLSLNHL